MLFSPVIKATKLVRNPNETEIAAGRETVYDTWMASFPDTKFGRPKYDIVITAFCPQISCE